VTTADISAAVEASAFRDLLIVLVMAGLVPAIHVFGGRKKDVDARVT
jgi:hypothetical protein